MASFWQDQPFISFYSTKVWTLSDQDLKGYSLYAGILPISVHWHDIVCLRVGTPISGRKRRGDFAENDLLDSADR